MTISPPIGRAWRLAGATAALTLTLGLAAACGSSSTAVTATPAPGTATTTASGQSSTAPGGRNGQAQNRSAANGTIAAVNGSSLQVQSTDSQSTVNVTDSTTITAAGTVDMSAVTAGLCITASANPTGTTPSSGTTPTTDAGSNAASEPFTASMIQLSDPENGLCSSGFAGGGAPPDGSALPSGEAPPSGAMPPDGAVPSGLPDFGGTPPSGTPPSGAPQGGFAGLGGRAGGTVLSVSGDRIVISQTDPSTQAVTERTVTVDGSTTYTKRTSASTAALVVGQCAIVQGSVDSKGAVTATSVAVSAPTVGSTCSTGVGPGGPGGRGGPAGNGATTTAGS